jgi:hypothetical protein
MDALSSKFVNWGFEQAARLELGLAETKKTALQNESFICWKEVNRNKAADSVY